MRALLLLAGRSVRFWPLQEKSLFTVCGKTLLEHQVKSLYEGGVKEIVLVGGVHNLHEVRRLFPHLNVIQQKELALGMRGALLSALPLCRGKPVMIVSANDVVEPHAYRELLRAARATDGALLAKRMPTYFPGGYLVTRGKRVQSIVEKPAMGKQPSDLVTIVAHVHNDPMALLKTLQSIKGAADGAYERAVTTLAKEKVYEVVPYEGFWQPVKYPWHLLELLPHILQRVRKGYRKKGVHVHSTATIEGNVALGEGVRVLSYATIRGPCTIGAGTIVGTNSLVWRSSIGKHCVIGFGSEIKASVLSDHVWTHTSYIGDSVVGCNVTFGAGCVTGNFRLDEGEISSMVHGKPLPTARTKLGAMIGDDCRIGIQVGLNPGVKIGGGTFIAGGAFVTEDVAEKSFICMKKGSVRICPNRGSPPHPQMRGQYRENVF